MNSQFYIEKLNDSEEFKKFRSENPDAYFYSAFFAIDKEGNDNKQHLDYFVPKDKKIFSFEVNGGVKMTNIENITNSLPEKIISNHEIDFDKIEEMIVYEMTRNNIKNKVQRILLSLQSKNGKIILIGTIFISMMGLLKISINPVDGKIISFEKKSFFDMLKITNSNKKEEKCN